MTTTNIVALGLAGHRQIINVLPAIVANSWGFFIFREVDTSTPNVAKLAIAISFSIAAAAVIASSA